jgi:hypothetical protein
MQNILLELRVRGLAMEGDALEPQHESVPMNQKNDFQSHKRILCSEPKKPAIAQGCPLPGESADENLFFTVKVIDFDIEFLTGNF